jgi:hypothetical protein
MANPLKYLLTRIGEWLPSQVVYNMNAVVNYLEVGRWMHVNGYKVKHRADRREQLFDIVGSHVAEKDVLYMEFGVFRGAATRYWSRLLRNPKSKLHGFDSFEGLPENWLPQRPQGYFSLHGEVPQIDDARVQFFKGWFEETLPHYTLPPHDVLVLNFDADLYSSTIFVLDTLANAIVPGTFIYFDEFNHQFHELRAFDEFAKKTGTKFEVLGATRTLEHVLFRRAKQS